MNHFNDSSAPASVYEQIVAVDLGSNSFRLQVGRVLGDQIYPLDSLKEPVRLASGLTATKQLDAAAQARGLAALRRFGERLRNFKSENVRVVATNTLRVAKNAADFLLAAEEALGFPIEIISGREEARLIYIGAAHSLPTVSHNRLVVDIGGGSTEFIIGKRLEPRLVDSLYMGCVSYSLRFFPGNKVDKKRFRQAYMAAAQELESIARDYKGYGWQEAIGTSGTARAIADILELNHLNPGGVSGITRQGLETLRALLIRAGSAEAMGLDGISNDRLPVLAGGLAIMCAVFTTLNIDTMGYGEGALRLGVLYDLLGRFHHHDIRDATVSQFVSRYQIDRRQAERVRTTALNLLGQLVDVDAVEHADDARYLKWASSLHEIGISIAHSGFHKHGAYVLSASDMPGFSKKDQGRLASLVLCQRGKLDKLAESQEMDAAWPLVFCLRLAALMHRSRRDGAVPAMRVFQDSTGFHLELPDQWLAFNPLSATSLADEAAMWRKVGADLRVTCRDRLAETIPAAA